MSLNEIMKLEKEIYEKTQELVRLKRDSPRTEVKNYDFKTLTGSVSLKDLFAGKDRLLAIHNMGQGCRYCTLWADGINPFIPHLESTMAVALLSKDDPETQRRIANERNWRFNTASHDGGNYIKEQSVMADADNMPGAVLYELEGDKIYRKNVAIFGPYDLYCSIWHLLGLAGINEETFTPQFNYWRRPQKMDDGGKDLKD